VVRQDRRRAVLAGLASAVLLAGSASAQTVRGWVLDETDGQPVRGTVLAVLHAERDTVLARQLAADGSFQILVRDTGTYRLWVEALGYAPLIVALDLHTGTVLTLELKLRPDALALDPVRVVAERREPVYMQDFRRRQSSGFGRFVTREDIEQTGGASLPDVLQTVPGLRLVDYAVGSRIVPLVATRALSASGDCFAALYVNGVRQFEMRTDQPGGPVDPGMLAQAEDMFRLSASEIEAVEVYRGAAEVPAEFSGSTARCGVVAVWLRAGHEPHFGGRQGPDARFHLTGVLQQFSGRHAPAAAFAAEAGIYWTRSPRVKLGARLQRGEHQLSAASMAELTARLDPASYRMPAGGHPMTVYMAGIEAQFQVLDRGPVRGTAAPRLHGGRRSFTLPHAEQGRSSFSAGAWGAGAAIGGDLLLTERLALQATLARDWLRFGRFLTLDPPDGTTAATWAAASFRVGFSYILVQDALAW
jgi:hypothetical protein